jgi:hypothetical protein
MGEYTSREYVSGWAAWSAFAGIMMVIGGIWWIISGISALANDTFFVVSEDYVFKFNVTTWGWIHIILGVVILLAGIAIFSGQVWARMIGVIIAVVWALVAFAWLPIYPIWAILYITISVFVIWTLTVHGRDITAM